MNLIIQNLKWNYSLPREVVCLITLEGKDTSTTNKLKDKRFRASSGEGDVIEEELNFGWEYEDTGSSYLKESWGTP